MSDQSMPVPLLSGNNPQQKKVEIREYFDLTFTLYEQLFDCICNPKGYLQKAIPIRQPLIFYFAHTAVFYINKLDLGGYDVKRVDPRIEKMMAVGVDERGGDDLADSYRNWPDVEDILVYRAKVRRAVLDFIDQMPISLPIQPTDPAWAILMGIEHERIHLETSSVLIRQLPFAWVEEKAIWPRCEMGQHNRYAVTTNGWVAIQGAIVDQRKRDDTFGWDNEYGGGEVYVDTFDSSVFLVSNAEYGSFVEAGGYDEARWWGDEGWAWRTAVGAVMPTFWVGNPSELDTLQLRLMAHQVAMPWDWPAEVNHLEASAFCRWKSVACGDIVRLPSESEWLRIRTLVAGEQPQWRSAPGNIDLAYWASPCPIDRFKQGSLYDVVGNVWQWTSTPLHPFPGFRVDRLYEDFSTPSFGDKHFVIKGGSWMSTGNQTLSATRQWFRRHVFQHAGVRYVRSPRPIRDTGDLDERR